MSVVLVTGGTGTLGSQIVPILAARGHEVRVLSRQPGRGTHVGDLTTGRGLAQAAAGVDLVVHAATDSRPLSLGRADPQQTSQLLAAVPGCRHLLYVSIVGIDAIPSRYYRSKLACEQLVAASSVPSTTLRATQFHELIAMALRAVSYSPVAALPLAWKFQSVAAAEVATRAADLLEGEPLGRTPDFGGPEVLTAREILQTWRHSHRWPRVAAGIGWPGRVYAGFAAGRNTCPEHADGLQTWAEFVRG